MVKPQLMALLIGGLLFAAAYATDEVTRDLFSAIENQDLAGVQDALVNGADVHARRMTILYNEGPDRGYTPLMVAAMHSGPNLVQELIDAGADVNGWGFEEGRTVHTSSPEWVRRRTALMLAAEHNPDPEVSLTLLQAGAWLDARTGEIVRVLTGRDSPRFPYPVVETQSFTAIGLALQNNPNPAVAEVLIAVVHSYRYPDIGEPDSPVFAAKYGSAQLINDFIDIGMDINQAYVRLDLPADRTYRVTALHAAVESSNYETARTLLTAGADANALAGDHGYTPLVSAVLDGNLEMIQLLLDAGASPTAGRNALLTALSETEDSQVTDILAAAVQGDTYALNPEEIEEHIMNAVMAEDANRLAAVLAYSDPGVAVLTEALGWALAPVTFGRWDFGSRHEMAELLIAAGANATIPPIPGRPDHADDYVRESAVGQIHPDLYVYTYPRYQGFEATYPYWQRLELTLLLIDAGLQMPDRVLDLYVEKAADDARVMDRLAEYGFVNQ